MAEKKGVGHAYNVDFLNVVFAASSIFLFLSVIWMVWDDFDREWKSTQRRFAQLEYQVTQAQRAQAAQSVDKTKLAQLDAQRKAAEAQIAANKAKVDELNAKLADADKIVYRATLDYNYMKATYDQDRYDFEASRSAGASNAGQKGQNVAEEARQLNDLDLARQKAEADLKLQKALRIPDPSFLVQYEHEPPDQPNTIGVGVSFPLPLWNRNRGGIQAATVNLTQAALQVEKTKALIAADIATAELAYTDASARWRRQRDFILPKAADIRQTIAFAYEKGGASLLDLLLAERNDNEVRLATAQAAADTATAAAALKAALNAPEPAKNPAPK